MSKYIIEIEDEPIADGLYKAKAFKSLVFDEYGLAQLEKVEEEKPRIEVGDLLESYCGESICIATNVSGSVVWVMWEDGTSGKHSANDFRILQKNYWKVDSLFEGAEPWK